MSYHPTEHDRKIPPWLVLALAAVFGLLAGPAILLGAALRLALKRLGGPRLAWFLLALLGIGGAWLMVTSAHYVLAIQLMVNAFPPLPRWTWPAGVHFFRSYVLPLWTRSLLVTPLSTALWELFLPSNMEEHLLDQDHKERAAQNRATVRAKRAARRVPAQIAGQAVIGVVVKSPNSSYACPRG